MTYFIGYFVLGFIVASLYAFKEKDTNVAEFLLMFILYPIVSVAILIMIWVEFLTKDRRKV